MTFIAFITQYEIIVPSRRLDAYHRIALRPTQLLTHNMFGEARLGFTDGVHALVLFVDGVREIHLSNLTIKSPEPEPSLGKINPSKTSRTSRRDAWLADFLAFKPEQQ